MKHSGKIGIVTARFNPEVTSLLREGAMRKLGQKGVAPDRIVDVSVPGAFEIPLAAKALLQADCDSVIALGAVIRGETSHYDYVCNAVERGCSDVQLEFTKPVVFGVLTTENEEQAMDRVGGRHGHKGEEAAEVALEMMDLLKKIRAER